MYNTYESIAFLSKDEATEVMAILEEEGESAALRFLKRFYEPGEGTLVSTRDNPWKEHDHLFEEENWIMYYNFEVPYIGLVCRLQDLGHS